ncbi:MAG: ferritin-like domain-containing protein [Proteobacteria bacterium]|nr:ferritin-like domain-containing protein [Pseudomonadota bacterium]
MLTRRAFFERLVATPEAHRLLLDSLATGEAESAVDLDRFAALIPDARLSRQVYRHYAEEQKHARWLRERVRATGREPAPLPAELDYERLSQGEEIGLPRERLARSTPLSDAELVRFFAGSKAGEERACKEMAGLIAALDHDPETRALLRAVLDDEERHVAYATLALWRLCETAGRRSVVRELRRARRAEARVHRRVSLAFSRRLLALLGAPVWVRFGARAALELGCAARQLWPGGLDRARIADPMPVPPPTEAPPSA